MISKICATPSTAIWRKLTDHEYAICFHEFLSRCNDWKAAIEWCGYGLPPSFTGHVRSILSVGGGTGAFDLAVAKQFFNLERFVSIEPNTDHVEAFKLNIAQYHQQGHDRFQVIHERFEEYLDPELFDLILMSHSLYYVDDLAQTLLKAKRLLSGRGALMIFHQTMHGVNQVQTDFKVVKNHVSSNTIQAILSANNIPYLLDIVPAHIDLVDHPDELIYFFLEHMVPQETVLEVRRYLEQHGERMYHPVAIFRIV